MNRNIFIESDVMTYINGEMVGNALVWKDCTGNQEQ